MHALTWPGVTGPKTSIPLAGIKIQIHGRRVNSSSSSNQQAMARVGREKQRNGRVMGIGLYILLRNGGRGWRRVREGGKRRSEATARAGGTGAVAGRGRDGRQRQAQLENDGEETRSGWLHRLTGCGGCCVWWGWGSFFPSFRLFFSGVFR